MTIVSEFQKLSLSSFLNVPIPHKEILYAWLKNVFSPKVYIKVYKWCATDLWKCPRIKQNGW